MVGNNGSKSPESWPESPIHAPNAYFMCCINKLNTICIFNHVMLIYYLLINMDWRKSFVLKKINSLLEQNNI